MPSTSSSTEHRILARLLRIAPYATAAFSGHHFRALIALRQRGLVHMDAWGVVSLTWRGELAAMAVL